MRYLIYLLKRILLLQLFLFCIGYGVHAQDEVKTSKTSVQLQLGVPGIGLGFRYAVLPRLGIRAGLTYGGANLKDKIQLDDVSSTNRIKGSLTVLSLRGEYSVAEWLRLVAGAGYHLNTGLSVNFSPDADIEVGNYTVKQEDTGALEANVKYGGLAPYAGLGIGRGMPRKRFNVTLDVGSYYMNSPKVTVEGSKMFRSNNENAERLEANLKDYRWLPVLMLNLNFKI
jgi:hypothetical protein